ncbi:esterase/lipase family protein [Rubritalea spongiae]|uniref:Esterase/lipase family protein n=1 Tax=Rubritalea spongiae TaxID=430797 RepID=A0ABW5E4S9_9BACT
MSSRKSSKVIDTLGVLRTPMPWHKPSKTEGGDELVILMHGLWRSYRAMDPIVKAVTQNGYSALNIPYPSYKESLEEMVMRLHRTIEVEREHYSKIHFVTHSLGGVIVRNYLHNYDHTDSSRVVMLAPPLRGSKIVDWLQGAKLNFVLGPAGSFLSTESMAREPDFLPTQIETAVIMGNRVRIPLLHKIIDDESDGIVSVESGKAGGVKEFKVISADHTLITLHEEVLAGVPRFLKTGSLQP